MKNQNSFYLGLDIGTNSVGYAVTDEQYNLLRFKGQDAWGTHIFDEGSLNAERRSFRTARRRLDRRQQRVSLVQELFAEEISKVDPRFFIRIQESYKYRDEVDDKFTLFNDDNYSDVEYYNEYPTIHHLIVELMNNKEAHDVRLVYLACAWLVAHRGHFLSNINKDNLANIKDFDGVYDAFMSYFSDNEYKEPWGNVDREKLAVCLKTKMGVNAKYKELLSILNNGQKAPKLSKDGDIDEDFPFSLEGIIKILAGGTYLLKDLFGKEEYDSLENKSVSLSMDDEKLGSIMADIGDDYDLIAALRSIYDWAVLVDVLGDSSTISESKVRIYEQHKKDLETLKYFVRNYLSDKEYNEIFRLVDGKANYPSYVNHTDEKDLSKFKTNNKEDFSKFILSKVKNIKVKSKDESRYSDMISRLELRTFMPKQKDTDNRVIPYQLYWYELSKILENAKTYLPLLSNKDENGITVSNKIESVFAFRIPYFVGPLNSNSSKAWIVRKEGNIYPWNFDDMVDLDACEEEFIKKMTNTCTYLPGESVLPKDSLLYHKFMVLNEINNLRINGERISVELKQRIYKEVFLNKKKVTRKYLTAWLVQNGYLDKGQESSLSGIDEEIKSNLIPQISFKKLMDSKVLSVTDVERIIERASYAEDKSRLSVWLKDKYPNISEEDRKYICSIKIKDFGRLSRKLLCGIEGIDKVTGELVTIENALWNSQNNFMEIIADESKYDFATRINDFRTDYYTENPVTLDERLNEMYLSNTVKRQVYRTLDVVKDIKKAFGEPKKIFVEMARGGDEDQKGKRTKSRKDQILELYALCKDEEVKLLKKQLDDLGVSVDNMLQGEKLFLYFMQLGKCMYTGESIELEKLGSKDYDVDHIYPQAYVKDDSILNNKVLVTSESNGKKSDIYPIADNVRKRMHGQWSYYRDMNLITEEKYKRLTRATQFTDEEKYGFINRQIVETSQSTKAVATLLQEKFPNAEIVYTKARLASDFRHEFDVLKSRTYNDLHHAVDAYLNIVVGNVYNLKFTKNFNINSRYSIKTKTIFSNQQKNKNVVFWDGKNMLTNVKSTAKKNTAHFTKYSFFKKGGLFDQNPVSASKKVLTPIKKDRPTERYGGYNSAGIMFYIPVKYRLGNKNDIFILSVELLYGKQFLKDEAFAKEYAKTRLSKILNKPIENISFPMGMRPWKVNTVLSLNGFNICISGIASKGKQYIAQSMIQFSSKYDFQKYIKKLERFVEKNSKNPNYVYDEEYDKISKEKNVGLFDLYIDKYENSIYKKRINKPLEILKNGRNKFLKLNIVEQSKILLNIHQTFGRTSDGVDLALIDGSKSSSTTKLSASILNWKKNYSDIRIVDVSPSGLFEKKSVNLLSLL